MTLTLPAELLAERAVLACMLDDAALAKLAAAALRPEHFTDAGHREIYVLFQDLLQRTGTVDLVEADAEARRLGITLGSLQRIGDLAEAECQPARIEAYVRLITDAHERRGAQEELFKAQESLSSNNGWREHFINLGKMASASTSPHAGGLKFLSAVEVMEAEAESADWLWAGYLARGCVTLEVGKPKIGKTTLTFGLLQAAHTGKPFLRRATKRFGTVYLTEEAIGTIQEKVDRFGLGTHEGLHFISKRQNPGLPFSQVLTEASRIALDHGAELLVIDTLTRWGGLDREGENSSGDADRLMGWILDAAGKHNLAIKVVHHSPKRGEGADPVDMVRGSSALAAAADIVIAVAPDQAERSLRRVLASGRYAATPEIVTIKLNGEEYEIVDAPNNSADKHAPVIAALPYEPPGKTEAELIAETGLARWKVQTALSELLGEGITLRTGKGGKADPYRHHRGEAKVDPF